MANIWYIAISEEVDKLLMHRAIVPFEGSYSYLNDASGGYRNRFIFVSFSIFLSRFFYYFFVLITSVMVILFMLLNK